MELTSSSGSALRSIVPRLAQGAAVSDRTRTCDSDHRQGGNDRHTAIGVTWDERWPEWSGNTQLRSLPNKGQSLGRGAAGQGVNAVHCPLVFGVILALGGEDQRGPTLHKHPDVFDFLIGRPP